MLKRVIKKGSLNDTFHKRINLAYWLTKSPRERIAAVELLRRQYNGSAARLQRTVTVVQRAQKEFIANKKAIGRHKDLADVEALGG